MTIPQFFIGWFLVLSFAREMVIERELARDLNKSRASLAKEIALIFVGYAAAVYMLRVGGFW